MTARTLSLAFLLLLSSFPSLAAGRDVAPRTIGPSPFQTTSVPQVAYAGGRFLTVWRESMGGAGSRLMGALSDADGRRISASALVVAVAGTWDIDVVGTGDSFAVFWEDSNYVTTHMVNVDLEGRVSGQRVVPLPDHIDRTIAWNGTHFLAALRLPVFERYDAEAVLFTRAGEIVRAGIPLDPYTYWMDISVVDSGFFVFTTGAFATYAHHIQPDGSVTQTRIEDAQNNAQAFNRPQRIASTPLPGGGARIAWSASSSSASNILTATITLAGQLSQPKVAVAGEHALIPLELRPVAGGFVLAYTENVTVDGLRSVRARRLGEDGSPSALPEESNGVQVGGYLHPSAVSERAILIAAQTPEQMHASTVAIDGAARISPSELVSVGLSAQAEPALGSAGGVLLAAWTEYIGLLGTARSAPVNALGEPLPHRDLAANVAVAANDIPWSGTHYLVVGRQEGKIVGQRLRFSGEPEDEEPFVIGTAPYVQQIAVSWAFDRWVVIWHLWDEVFFTTVSPAGVVSAPRKLAVVPVPPPNRLSVIHEVAIAFDGPNGLLAWTVETPPVCYFPMCPGGPFFTAATRIERDGTIIDATPAPLNLEQTYELSATARDGEIAILADAPEGTVLTRMNTATRALTRHAYSTFGVSDLAWDGAAYVIATRKQRELLVRRVTPDGTDVVRGIRVGDAFHTPKPSIAAAFSGNATVAIEETDVHLGSRVVLYQERDLEPITEAPRRRTVRK